MSTLARIEKRSAEGQALAQLRAAILDGTLPPGARLTEMALSDQLGTSRATIRTALHHLVAEGLVVQVPYTGWMVTSLTADDAWELVTLRASFEHLAATLAAERASAGDREALAAAFDKLIGEAEAGRAATVITAADLSFHRAIVSAAGHERLGEHYRRVAQQVSILIASSNAMLSDPRQLVAQHQPLFEALMARDASNAGTLARRHVEEEGAKLVAQLRALEAAPSALSTRTRKAKVTP